MTIFSLDKNSHFLTKIALFFFVLGCVGLTLNEKTVKDFNLQQIGVESLVERHTFALEGSKVPELRPLGDTFSFHDHVYAIKQPGQFVLGAMVYSIVREFGLTYERSYVMTSSVVTLGSSGILLSLLAVSIYIVVTHMTRSARWGLFTAVVSSVGTSLLPYAGVAHHDLQATSLIFIGWSLMYCSGGKKSPLYSWLSGILIASSLFISMLPIGICFCVGMYVLGRRGTVNSIWFILGSMMGIVPVFLFNYLVFGNVLAFPNIVSGTTDTTPSFSFANVVSKLHFYLFSSTNSLFVFSPVFLLAIVGLFFLAKKNRLEAVFIGSVLTVHIFYLASLQTVGDAQYGPRYLLPILPFLSVGLVGIYKAHPLLKYISIILAIVSGCIAWVGAFGGVMYQTIWIHPFPEYFSDLVAGRSPDNPLRLFGYLFLIVSGSIFYAVFSMSDRNFFGSSDALPTKNPSI